jgi:hypothetical protein
MLIPSDPEAIPKQDRDDPEPIPNRSRSKFEIIPKRIGIKSGSRCVSPLKFGIKGNSHL